MTQADVLVAGAGPAGLTLACDLARRGVAVRIVDRAPEFAWGSRGKGLSPRSQEVLDDLGLIDELLKSGVTHMPYRKYRGAEVIAETDERSRTLAFEASEEFDRLHWRDFNSRLLQRLEVAEHLWGATQAELEAAFVDPANFTVYPEAREALNALRAAGYRLAIVSNWSWQLPDLCAALDLAAPFERIVASARVGFAKPHPGIFRHALVEMRVAPDGGVHVGDNPVADVGGGLEAGIRPVLLDRDGRNAGVEAPHRVADLRALVELLEGWRRT